VKGNHGFVLQNGTYTTVDVPGVNFTQAADSINDRGEIVGAKLTQLRTLPPQLLHVLEQCYIGPQCRERAEEKGVLTLSY